jgi:hypothetical protein
MASVLMRATEAEPEGSLARRRNGTLVRSGVGSEIVGLATCVSFSGDGSAASLMTSGSR